MTSFPETLAVALEHHQAGRLLQAAQLYHEILQQYPDRIDVLQLLGIIAAESDNYELAIECFSKALKVNPLIPDCYYNLGNVLQLQGRQEEAIAYYKQALTLNPNYAKVHNNLGLAMDKQGNIEAAIASYRQAIALEPNCAEFHGNLADALQEQQRLEEAIFYYRQAITLQPNCAEFYSNLASTLQMQNHFEEAIAYYQQALTLQPNSAEIHNYLGVALQQQKRIEEAMAHYQQALSLEPNAPGPHINLGNVLREQGQLQTAITHYQQALALDPDFPEAHYVLGTALAEQGQLQTAITHYQQALALNPNYLDAYNNLGVTLMEQGQLQAAITYYQQALALNPNSPHVHYNLSVALLKGGDFQQGFAEHEWRWQTKDTPNRPFFQPLWDGSSLEGKTILLHGEQGLGDQIQFIRYVPLVTQYKGRIVVECSPPLARLFTSIVGISQIKTRGESLPKFDVHAPLMSLPGILDNTLETIPATIPYLYPVASIPLRLKTSPSVRLKVGIVWAGNFRFKGDHKRSCALSYFLKLLDPDIAFFSLQKGPQVEELTKSPQVPIQDLSSQLNDFADTASIVAQLDLVISVDTSVAHLAGALGKPTWVLLSFSPDWRWMLKREDSPWYPTMRLFRQSQPGDWVGVFEQVEQALHNYKGMALN